MSRFVRFAQPLLALSCLLVTACKAVHTIDDVVTESAAITDDRLVGHWRMIGGDDRSHVSRGPGNDYAVSYVDKEDSVQFRGRLGRLGSVTVLDVYPDMKQWAERDEAGVPTHAIFAIEFSGDSIGIRSVQGDSVARLLSSGRLRVPNSTFNGGDIVLHGDPARVRSALEEIVQQRRFMDETAWFKRSGGK